MPSIQFKGKSTIETYHHTVPHHRLEFVPKLSVLPKGQKPGLDGNLIIEGDNLIALKALLPTHAGKVKCVYIDPPYNTGNEGWIYNDNLTQPQFKEWIGKEVGKEGEDATRHDKWCCMMYPRLMLLKELMLDDGSIWVSIDDNELHQLRALMDEVFGAENFVGLVVWNTRNTDNRVGTMLSVDHEYVVVYTKRFAPLRGRVIDRSDFSNPDKDERGPYVTAPLTGLATAAERPNLHFDIVNPKTGDIYRASPGKGWITSREGVAKLIEEDRVWWPPNPKTGKPRKKRYLSETSERMPASTWWPSMKGASGADEVESILGTRLFAFPKPLGLLRTVVDMATEGSDIVLDCTAGSGTSAHAVLHVNKSDGCARRFIAIQQPYDSKQNQSEGLNICRSVTRERVLRAAAGYGYRDAKSKRHAEPGLGGSFTYVRVGPPLFSEYRDLGKVLPPYEDIAKYIFYTETSREIDLDKVDEQTGFIGRTPEAGGTAYYLLYTPNNKEDREFSTETLERIYAAEQGKARTLVVYCEKVWMHPEDIRHFADQNKIRIRAMLVPFDLK